MGDVSRSNTICWPDQLCQRALGNPGQTASSLLLTPSCEILSVSLEVFGPCMRAVLEAPDSPVEKGLRHFVGFVLGAHVKPLQGVALLGALAPGLHGGVSGYRGWAPNTLFCLKYATS